MKNLHTNHLFDELIAKSMEDALSSLPPWQETKISRRAEEILSSLTKTQTEYLRSYMNEIAEKEADEKQALYMQGILDGIALSGVIQLEQHHICKRWNAQHEEKTIE